MSWFSVSKTQISPVTNSNQTISIGQKNKNNSVTDEQLVPLILKVKLIFEINVFFCILFVFFK